MAGHGMPSEAYDAPHLYNPDAMDFTTSMDETFEDGVTEQGMPQLFHLNYPLPSQHQSSHLAFSSAEAGFFNPPQQPLPPSFLQRQSSGLESESSSRFETPLLGGMPLLVHHQSWPGAHSVHSSKPIPVPYLDTNFDLTPPDMGDFDVLGGDMNSFGVDPSLIQHMSTPNSTNLNSFSMNHHNVQSQVPSQMPSLSPAESTESPHFRQDPVSLPNTLRHERSPIFKYHTQKPRSRKQSIHSLNSQGSPEAVGLTVTDEDGKERVQCPYPECGKAFKDLKAHLLTHQNERPEKCPIASCEFHKRGFARKYDRNRHLVTTHYKATITCGFCPGEDSPSAKTFNRADVFKRHMVAQHGVDQNSSASKKRTNRGSAKQSPVKTEESSGKCSTCGERFPSPQELFDHLDDCILRVVTQKDPSEANNERHLRAVEDDEDLIATLQRHSLPSYPASSNGSVSGERESCSADPEDDEGTKKARKGNSGASLDITGDLSSHKSSHTYRKGEAGLTFSRGGHDLAVAKGRRKKKDYPQSWGCAADDMTLKKRVLCVFDGQRRLWKDDMMLGNQFEVRMQLPDGGFVTDLDVETLKRADAFHNATEEERGEWMPTNFYSGALPASPLPA